MANFSTPILFVVAAWLAMIPHLSLVSGTNIRLIDFQSNCIDLPRTTASLDAPQAAAVGTFPCVNNRAGFTWVATLTGLTNFNITSAVVPSIVLSVAAVGNTAPSSSIPLIDQPVLGRAGSIMTWKFVSNPNFSGKFNIVPTISPGGVVVALRSYPKRPATVTPNVDATYTPLFLDTLNVKDPQQVFTIQNV
ncbi:hypothetical protein CVT24_003739 [Panaeolus cyanescens]|uniref:Uncharacterized protein n=1 Tax=Panaeolus cyanescens TaxID=181874 RepID=A0A409YXL8_9AGAR|nr:hypothetical protein CVT24_003739 [Panaeolus cyanescens]